VCARSNIDISFEQRNEGVLVVLVLSFARSTYLLLAASNLNSSLNVSITLHA